MKGNEIKTDEDIVLLVQQGDEEEFGVIMDRYEKKLLRYARKFISDTYKIEDIVQDVFIKTYENIISFDTTLKFSPWIYRIAHNIFINEMKKKKTISFHLFEFDTIFPHIYYEDPLLKNITNSEMRDLVDKGLKNISEKYREILILYYMEDLNYREIADILKVPIGTVGVRLKRAKSFIKKQIPGDVLSR